jgi:hypothetical protein
MYDSTPGAAARGETTGRPAGTFTDPEAERGVVRTGAFASRPAGGAQRADSTASTTPSPPVPPLRREPGSTTSRRGDQQSDRDAQAPGGGTGPSTSRGSQGETMFGDRRRGER